MKLHRKSEVGRNTIILTIVILLFLIAMAYVIWGSKPIMAGLIDKAFFG